MHRPFHGGDPSVKCFGFRPLGDLILQMATILLVVDEAPVRGLIGTSLCQLGFHVLEGVDGLQALRILEESADHIDLIVTDINMPNMRGPDLVEAVWRNYPLVPVIYISSSLDEPQVRGHVE